MDIPIVYNDMISKCIKNFGLPKLKYVLVSADESERAYIDSQEALSHFLIRWQQKTSSAVKLSLVKDDRGELLTGQSDVTGEESGQQAMVQQPPRNVMHPQVLLQLVSKLKEKGQVTAQDVKALGVKNEDLNKQKIKEEERNSVLEQCLAILSEIMQQNAQPQSSDKSDGELGQSSQFQQLFSSKGSEVYRSVAINDQRRSFARQRDSILSLKDYMKNKQLKGSDNSQRNSFTGDSKKFATFTSRSRTDSSIFETPGGDLPTLPLDSEKPRLKCEQELFSQDKGEICQDKPSSSNKQPQKSKGGLSSFLGSLFAKKKDTDDDEISLISDAYNTILERTESQEISLALNESNNLALSESQINQSYMK